MTERDMCDINEMLGSLFRECRGEMPVSAEILPRSGSNRRYCRLRGSDGFSCIGVEGVDARENGTFCALSECFRSIGLNAPRVLAQSDDSLYYLQEDLGQDDLNSLMKEDRAAGVFSAEHESLLLRTVALLPEIQFGLGKVWDFSRCYPSLRMNGRKILFDLNYFKYCFLKPMGVEFNEETLQDEFEALRDDILSDPSDSLFLYRDFQSRNVMVRDGQPYFIDFQGGMQGPFYYDLASFVFQFADRYPEDLREKLVAEYHRSLSRYYSVGEAAFRSRLGLYVLLRHLQVLGCYGFRGLIEGKRLFIDCIPDGFRGIEMILSSPSAAYPYINECLSMLLEKGRERGYLR